MNSIQKDKYQLLPRIRDVTANDDYTLTLFFNNGEIKTFDMKPYISEKGFVFEELQDLELFKTVKCWEGTVQWINGQDLCPDTLYLKGFK